MLIEKAKLAFRFNICTNIKFNPHSSVRSAGKRTRHGYVNATDYPETKTGILVRHIPAPATFADCGEAAAALLGAH